jgi:hypothetical protein
VLHLTSTSALLVSVYFLPIIVLSCGSMAIRLLGLWGRILCISVVSVVCCQVESLRMAGEESCQVVSLVGCDCGALVQGWL